MEKIFKISPTSHIIFAPILTPEEVSSSICIKLNHNALKDVKCQLFVLKKYIF